MIRVTQHLAPARQAKFLSAITSYEPPKSPRKINTTESRSQDFGVVLSLFNQIRSKIGLRPIIAINTGHKYLNFGFFRQVIKIRNYYFVTGVGAVTLDEGEVLYMKLTNDKELKVKSRKQIITHNYLYIPFIASITVTSDLFMFDIICLASVLALATVYNGIFHARHKKDVLEIVKLPGDKIRVKRVTFYGGTKTCVYNMAECQLGDMQEFVVIGGEHMCISWSDVGKYNPYDEFYETYFRRERVLLHTKQISPFKEIDGVKFSEDLFGKDTREPAFVKKAIEEVKCVPEDTTTGAKMDDS